MKSKLDILTKLDNLLADMKIASDEYDDDELEYYANELESIILGESV
jgi:hypothetical protein